MSKAYKCDRCGCYFDYEKTMYFGAIKIDADFCPECVRSFEKWLKMEDEEESDEEIKLGDEVIGDFGAKGVVVGIDTYNDEIWLSLLVKNYKVPQCVKASMYKKTGRHFPQILEAFEQIKGEVDGK